MPHSTQALDSPMPYLDDLKTGDQLEPLVYEITQDLIHRYGLASLDLNPVHMNPAWCERAQVFGTPKTVQHGMMNMSFMASAVLRTFGPLADVFLVDSKFTKPGPVGNTITCRGKVRDVHVLNNGNDFAIINVEATDQDGDLVGISEVHVRLPRKPGANAV
ncbi:fatty acid synthase beta subunit [Stutzerimonas stutzeri A1501]|uniref:Fatty acid synthase beta subunit n=2 Tax=Pseudomonadales TaxID=72274 RepID=A4VH76_STUS1|nr:fatty acid synthase beta subunit [Stutzerimonas stutzeri A1501]TEP47832.1 MaoC family dehydratase [Pseudomonas aeruginosa]TEP56466.1 MaoC family dehydratase [Pseudomonas aeruginosa]SAJ30844.1 (3R)-hydroxyacyl-ACP dehydratase subunit HadB [Enterobacter cloacae]